MRKIEELLDLKTYQDMTDEEIELIISWHVKQAERANEYKLQVNEQLTNLEVFRETQLKRAELANAELKKLIHKRGVDNGA